MSTTAENKLTLSECNEFISIIGMPDTLPDLIMYCVELQSNLENTMRRIDLLNTKVQVVEQKIKSIIAGRN